LKMTIENLQKSFADHHALVKEALEKTEGKTGELSEKLKQLEQFLLARGSGGGQESKSWGEQVAESDEFKLLAKTRSGRAHIELKATITTASPGGGPLAPSDRLATPDMMPRRRLGVRDLLAPGRTNSTSVEYARQTTRTNAAATVAEEATKPESSLAWEWVNTPTKTIAHWVPATRQILDDSPNRRNGLSSVYYAYFRFIILVNNVVSNKEGVGASQYGDLAWGLHVGRNGVSGIAVPCCEEFLQRLEVCSEGFAN
jgi:HK97 family phage major capsid protein